MADKNTIVQRIALEGDQPFKAALQALGTAGEAVFNRIQAAAQRFGGASFTRLQDSFGRLKTAFGGLQTSAAQLHVAWSRLTDSGARVASALGTVATRATLLAGAAALVVGAFLKISNAAINSADALSRAADGAGVNRVAFAELAKAAEASGVGTEQFAKVMAKLSNAIAENPEKLRALGIATTGATGAMRTADQVLLDLADVFKRMPEGPEQTALAIDLLGEKLGPKFVAFLNAGRAGISAFTDELRKAGLTLTETDFKVLQLADDAKDRLAAALGGLRDKLGVLFAPSIIEGANTFAQLIEDNSQAIQNFGRQVATVVNSYLKDFFAILAGRARDVKNTWLLDARDALLEFGRTVVAVAFDIILPAWQAISNSAESVAQAINGVFGTEFTGKQLLVAGAVLQASGAFAVLTSTLGLLGNALRLVGPFFSGIAALGTFLGEALLFVGQAIAFVVTAIAGVLGLPVAVTAAIIAAVLAAAVAIYVYWDNIVAYAGQSWEKIKQVSADAVIAINNAIVAQNEKLKASFDGVAEIAARAMANVSKNVLAEAKIIAGAWEEIKTGAGLAFDFVAEAAGAVAPALQKAFSGDFSGAFEDIKKLFPGAVEAADRAWQSIKTGAQDAAGFLKNIFGVDFGAVFEPLRTAGEDAFTALAAAAQALGPRIRAAWTEITTVSTDVFDAVKQKAVAFVEDVKGVLSFDFSGIFSGMQAAAEISVSGIAEKLAGLPEKFSDAWNQITASAGEAFGKLPGLVTSAIGGVADAIGGIARTTLEAWSGASNSVVESAKAIAEAIARASDVAGNVQGAQTLAGQLVEPFTAAKAQIEQVFIDLKTRTDALAGEIASALQAALTQSSQAAAQGIAGQAATPDAAGGISAVIEQIKTLFADAQVAASQAIATMIAEAQTLPAQFAAIWQQAASGAGVFAQSVGDAIGQARAIVTENMAAITAQVQQSFAALTTLPAAFSARWQQAFTQIRQAALSAFAGIAAKLAAAMDEAAKAAPRLSSAWAFALGEMRAAMASFTASVTSDIRTLTAAIAALEDRLARANSGQGGRQGFAAGGRVTGPGTSTSDSVPAWLSVDEYVNRALAVKKYGVALFDMLNQARYPLDYILARFAGGKRSENRSPTFSARRAPSTGLVPALKMAMGGLVPRMDFTPRLAFALPAAGAGAGQQLLPTNIFFPGAPPMRVMAEPDVVGQMSRFALRQRQLSAGKQAN